MQTFLLFYNTQKVLQTVFDDLKSYVILLFICVFFSALARPRSGMWIDWFEPAIRMLFSGSELFNVHIFPFSTSMFLWASYISPWSICLFCCRKYVDRSILGIHKSLTDPWMWNWDWGHAIPRKGIHKWDFHCSVQLNPRCCRWSEQRTVSRHLWQKVFFH